MIDNLICTMKRRRFLQTILNATMLSPLSNAGLSSSVVQVATQEEDPLSDDSRTSRTLRIIDEESGDPDAEAEVLNVNKSMLDALLDDTYLRSRGIKKDQKKVALKQLEIARTYVGKSRKEHPHEINNLLRLFKYRLRYPNGSFVPYCAVGVAFCACQAYSELDPAKNFKDRDQVLVLRDVLSDINKYYFKPTPSCRSMVLDAEKRNIWVAKDKISPSQIKPGWLVMFDWKGTGVANHVGFVDHFLARKPRINFLNTIEFNTSFKTGQSQINGGAVAEKKREMKYVLGYIKTY